MRNKKIRIYCIILFTIISFFLPGCGFHLRGSLGEVSALPSIQVTNNLPIPWHRSLAMFFERSNIYFTEAGDWQLTLENFKETRRVASLNSRAKVAEYQLSIMFDYSLQDKYGNILSAPRSLSTTRSYRFNETQVVGKEQEELLLKTQMQDILFRSLLRNLNQLNKQNINARSNDLNKDAT